MHGWSFITPAHSIQGTRTRPKINCSPAQSQCEGCWSVCWSNPIWGARIFNTRVVVQTNETAFQKFHLASGSARHFLGPQVSALATLNLLAAFFSHSHSDASMRILHGYSSIGLTFGIYGSILLILSPDKSITIFRSFPLLVANILCFFLNTWITIYGMNIP